MTDKQKYDRRCYLIGYLEMVFVYHHVSFQVRQRFTDFNAIDASGITMPQRKCVLSTSLMRLK